MRLTRRLAFAAVLVLSTVSFANAAELVMVDLFSCQYCAKFRREVAPGYDRTAAGKLAPLRRINPLRGWPSDLADVTPARYTPVFILVDHGREIGRFAGYSDPDSFFAELKPLLARL
jgi:thioredoxin-related protein